MTLPLPTPNYGRDVNGNNPFTATLAGGYYDLTTPNEAYWSHVDFIVQQAAANGLSQCVLSPHSTRRLDTNFSGERNYSLPAIRSIPRQPVPEIIRTLSGISETIFSYGQLS